MINKIISFIPTKLSEALVKPSDIGVEKILELRVPYGSRLWGGSTSVSDYDYLIPTEYFSKLRELLIKYNIKYNAKDLGYDTIEVCIEFWYDNKKFQLNTPYEEYENAYFKAIDMVNKVVECKGFISNKENRVRIFDSAFEYYQTNKQLDKLITDTLRDKYPEYVI